MQHVLERRVTTLGSSRELFVECYVPRFKIYQLRSGDDSAITGQGKTPIVQMSLRARAIDFFAALERLYSVDQREVRYWRADIPTETNMGFEYPVGRLMTSGAEPFIVPDTDLDKALGDLLVNPSDEFIVEIKNHEWIVDLEMFQKQQQDQHELPSSSSKLNALTILADTSRTSDIYNGQPLFKPGGFFGEMSSRLGIVSSAPSNPLVGASPTLQPPANISGRSKPTLGSRSPGTLGLGNLCVLSHRQHGHAMAHCF